MKIIKKSGTELLDTCNRSIQILNIGDIIVLNNIKYKVLQREFYVEKYSLIKDDFGIDESKSVIYVEECSCNI